MFYLFIIILLLLNFFQLQAFDNDNFHTIFTFIHSNPCILESVFQLEIPEYVEYYCDKKKNYIHTLENLENSAFIHIQRIYDNECPFIHETCNQFCNLYNSCKYDKRILYYLEFQPESIAEVLLKSDAKSELDIIYSFITSKVHGEIILNKNFNYYGFASYHNLFNVNLIKSNRNLITNKYELKDTVVYSKDNSFLLTINPNCNFENLIYNSSYMFIYQI